MGASLGHIVHTRERRSENEGAIDIAAAAAAAAVAISAADPNRSICSVVVHCLNTQQ